MDRTTEPTTRSTVADVLLLVQERRIPLSLYKLSALDKITTYQSNQQTS